MECNGRKSEVLKPILLKAGIPIALSLAGFIYSLIITTRKPQEKTSSTQSHVKEEEDGHHELTGNTQITDLLQSSLVVDNSGSEEGILGLKSWNISLDQDTEWALETWFARYRGLKEHEFELMEVKNMLALEIAGIEFVGMKVKFIDQLETMRLENGLLKKKVRKLLRRKREWSRSLHTQALVFKDKEAEVLRCQEELDTREHIIKEMENEMADMEKIVMQLQEEKNGLVEKISASSTSKEEPEEISTKDEDQIQQDRAAEAGELIYLRWVNSCLRHELVKIQEQQIHDEQDVTGEEMNEQKSDHNLNYDSDGALTIRQHGETSMAVTTASPKKPNLLYKLRKWVKGSERCKSLSDENVSARFKKVVM